MPTELASKKPHTSTILRERIATLRTLEAALVGDVRLAESRGEDRRVSPGFVEFVARVAELDGTRAQIATIERLGNL